MTTEVIEIVVDPTPVVEVVTPSAALLVEIAIPGIQGPAGTGGGAERFTFTQASPALTWTIAHNLGARPVVDIIDVTGARVVADITHLSVNTLQVSFSVATAGVAVCV